MMKPEAGVWGGVCVAALYPYADEALSHKIFKLSVKTCALMGHLKAALPVPVASHNV